MLSPWARCYLWCKDSRVPMIAPMWTQVRIGPYLRCEKDKRQYQRYFHHTGYISGPQRLLLLTALRRIPEGEVLGSGNTAAGVVVFRGMHGLFSTISSRHAEVLAELKRITKPVYLSTGVPRSGFIGIHVRRGDFSASLDTEFIRRGARNLRIPIRWYISCLKTIRKDLGLDVQAIVFSDGTEPELRELLNLPNVRLYQGPAITSLLAMSEASGIITSGSTFSIWGSFLGQVPSVWYPGQRRMHVISSDEQGTLEPEWERGETFPEDFLATLFERVTR